MAVQQTKIDTGLELLRALRSEVRLVTLPTLDLAAEACLIEEQCVTPTGVAED